MEKNVSFKRLQAINSYEDWKAIEINRPVCKRSFQENTSLFRTEIKLAYLLTLGAMNYTPCGIFDKSKI